MVRSLKRLRDNVKTIQVHMGGFLATTEQQADELEELRQDKRVAQHMDLSGDLPLGLDEDVDTFFGDPAKKEALSIWISRGPPTVTKAATTKAYARSILEHIFTEEYLATHYYRSKK